MFRIEAHGAARLLRMDDGKVNAMGPAFLEGLGGAWREAAREGGPVVLAGNAKAFSAGLDLKTLPALDEEGMRAFVHAFVGLFRDVWTYPGPVVAAVDGPALAGGAVLALCSDFRLVAPTARLGLTEVPVGMPFPRPIAELAAARLPPQEHAPALLQGAIRQGADALRQGWAHRLVEPAQRLVPEALALAEELGALDAVAFRAAKASLQEGVARGFERFLKEEADAYATRLAAPERREAIQRHFQRITARR